MHLQFFLLQSSITLPVSWYDVNRVTHVMVWAKYPTLIFLLSAANYCTAVSNYTHGHFECYCGTMDSAVRNKMRDNLRVIQLQKRASTAAV